MESNDTVNRTGTIDYVLCMETEMELITESRKQTCVKATNPPVMGLRYILDSQTARSCKA